MRSFVIGSVLASVASVSVPNVPLKNAAKAGLLMPAMGLGTFGYSTTPVGGDCTKYPECWDTKISPQCSPVVLNRTGTFLSLAQAVSSPVRLDSANDYFNNQVVGVAIKNSGIARSNLFVTSKIGNAFAMG
jgi:diketogulonate reductase-like aldo/keto reductase